MNPSEAAEVLPVGTIIIELLGGLALFLFGMEMMTNALKVIAGSRLKNILAKLTTNPFKGVLAGATVTAIIQSSSVTTVLVVGFISAGLMTLQQSIGVILGADIGTTITAQVIAFKVTKYALILVAVGFAMLFISKKKKVQQYGYATMGLGLIFFGMNLMGDATRPLRTYQPFIDMMQQMDNPLVGILIGTLFTSVVQSSSATMGIIIVLASQGFITLEAGIALALGANIGTCVTALLAAIGQPPEAVRAAVVHVIFKVVGVLLWFGFIDILADVMRFVSPSAPELEGTARLAAESPRQIANAHTAFNLANTLIFIWLINPLARFMEWLIPDKPARWTPGIEPKYLDTKLLNTPELALDRVRLELGRLGDAALKMVNRALPTVFQGGQAELEALARMDDDVDGLHGSIISYLGQLSKEHMLQAQTDQLSGYMAVSNYIESIADMVETNLVEAGSARLQNNIQMSAATQEILTALHEKVVWSVEASLEALINQDQELAEDVMAAKLDINRLAGDASEHLADRLTAQEPNRVELFNIETEIIEYLKRVYYFAKRIAKVVAYDLQIEEATPAPARSFETVEMA